VVVDDKKVRKLAENTRTKRISEFFEIGSSVELKFYTQEFASSSSSMSFFQSSLTHPHTL